jgi:hypothetical protein
LCNNSEIYNDLSISQYGDENMSCPMYKDFTRECVEKFKEIINISNFEFCDLDKYKECPFYRALNEPEKLCEYVDRCHHDETIWKLSFERITWASKTYCFSENKVNCERYKAMKTGKAIPEGLRVDGSRIELKT